MAQITLAKKHNKYIIYDCEYSAEYRFKFPVEIEYDKKWILIMENELVILIDRETSEIKIYQ